MVLFVINTFFCFNFFYWSMKKHVKSFNFFLFRLAVEIASGQWKKSPHKYLWFENSLNKCSLCTTILQRIFEIIAIESFWFLCTVLLLQVLPLCMCFMTSYQLRFSLSHSRAQTHFDICDTNLKTNAHYNNFWIPHFFLSQT